MRPNLLGQVKSIVFKDLRRELRTREITTTTVSFSIMLLVLFAFGFYRSDMNITWRLPSEELEAQFIKEAAAAGFSGLKGHRSVGGVRASIYNAFPVEGVDALVSFMQDFEKRNG